MRLSKLKIKIIASVLAFTMVMGIVVNGVKHSKACNNNNFGTETLRRNSEDIKDMSLDELEKIFNTSEYEEEFKNMISNANSVNVNRGGTHLSTAEINDIVDDIYNQLPSDIKEQIEEKGVSLFSIIEDLVDLVCDPERDKKVEEIIIFISETTGLPIWMVRVIVDTIFWVLDRCISCEG